MNALNIAGMAGTVIGLVVFLLTFVVLPFMPNDAGRVRA